MGLRASRLYVELDVFPMEVKLYTRDLEAATGVAYTVRNDTLLTPEVAGGDAPSFRVGDGVLVVTHGYDEAARRWQLVARREDDA